MSFNLLCFDFLNDHFGRPRLESKILYIELRLHCLLNFFVANNWFDSSIWVVNDELFYCFMWYFKLLGWLLPNLRYSTNRLRLTTAATLHIHIRLIAFTSSKHLWISHKHKIFLCSWLVWCMFLTNFCTSSQSHDITHNLLLVINHLLSS